MRADGGAGGAKWEHIMQVKYARHDDAITVLCLNVKEIFLLENDTYHMPLVKEPENQSV